jgi:hypothetical protein
MNIQTADSFDDGEPKAVAHVLKSGFVNTKSVLRSSLGAVSTAAGLLLNKRVDETFSAAMPVWSGDSVAE